MDFPSWRTLATIPQAPTPYRGGYCMRIRPGDTNDHTLTEGDINIADTATAWIRFALFISNNFGATADDIFNIFEWQAGGTIESVISLQITAATDLVDIAASDGIEASTGFSNISKGVWHEIEAGLLVSTGGTGTLQLFVDGVRINNLTSQTHAAAITDGILGTQGTLSTTDAGYLLFDEFAFDNTRLGYTARWEKSRLITSSSFMFVGPGKVKAVTILDGGSGDVSLELYDTDTYRASMSPVWRSRTVVNNTDVPVMGLDIPFSRGCLAVLGGTLPGAIIQIDNAVQWGSDAAIKSYAINAAQERIGQ